MCNHDACKFFRAEIKVLNDFVDFRGVGANFWDEIGRLYFLDVR